MNDPSLFEWNEGRDGNRFWFWDEVHCPVPFSPLTMSSHTPLISEGTASAAAELRMPFDGSDLRFFHGYLYHGPRPLQVSDEERCRRALAHSELLAKKIFELPELWNDVWLPELDSFHGFQKAVRLGELDWKELDSYRRKTNELDRRRWTIHFTLWNIFAPALEEYLAEYRSFFGEAEEANAFKLLQGFENRTTQTDQEIWRLARYVKDSKELRALFEDTPLEAISNELGRRSDGEGFRAELDRFLDTFGYRTASFVDLADTTWLEDPGPVFISIKHCLHGNFLDPRARRDKLAEEREAALARIRSEIERSERFCRLLRVMQALWPVTESHQFYLDQPSHVHARFLYLEYGHRFARTGSLSGPDDVFFLTEEELLSTANHGGRGDLTRLVLERKELMEEWRNFQPPPFLGTPPAQETDGHLRRFFGPRPQTERETAQEICGASGAPGKAIGRVRVLHSVNQATLLQPGEVLVARTTTPAWTPLFGLIGAVVTDSGGVLCHGAVVAREYGIPAVVGTHVATRVLKDGDRVLVDGTEGKVILLGEEPG